MGMFQISRGFYSIQNYFGILHILHIPAHILYSKGCPLS